MDPLLRFNSTGGGSARCGGRPGTLSLDPATFEKVDETFKRFQLIVPVAVMFSRSVPP